MSDLTESKKRILVVLSSFQNYQDILEIATSLAVNQGAELSALFVEDINLVRLAGLPFVKEIDRLSSHERQLDALNISYALEKQAQKVRKQLDDATKYSQLQVSLKVVRGHFLAEAIAVAKVDLLLLEKKTHSAPYRSNPKDTIQPVWVLYDGGQAAGRALALAHEILHKSGVLNIILQARNKKDIALLKKQVEQVFATSYVQLHFFTQLENNFTFILQCIRQRGCGLMILSRQNRETVKGMAALFAEETGCPILLVS
jgi:hypothetical protein